MPITAQQAVSQLSDAIQAQGKFNFGNVLDAVIGVAASNQDDLQAMLNNFLTKKGVLTQQDEDNLNALLAKKEEEKKQRQKIRTRNTIVAVTIGAVIIGVIVLAVKKKNAKNKSS